MSMEIFEALTQLERERGISKQVLLEAIEAALVSAFRRHYGSSQNVRVRIESENGKIQVFARRNVVDDVRDPRVEVSVGDARRVDVNFAPGDVLETEVTPKEFGRIAAQTAKQVVVQRIREAERGIIYEEYSNREGELVTGIVQRHEQRNVIVDLGKVEAIMPPPEQMPREMYSHGDRVKAYIVEVRKTTKGPQVIISRTHPGLLKRLFELEVPEIYEGIVEVKQIAREAGMRSKIAVYSRDENVDAVGACVGPRGMRVQKIVNELRGEKIDVVAWDHAPEMFVANALSPAKVLAVRAHGPTRVAKAVVPDNQLSLAIGKEGQNARLAAKVTGWKIDIRSESQAAEEPEEVVEEIIEELEAPEGVGEVVEGMDGIEGIDSVEDMEGISVIPEVEEPHVIEPTEDESGVSKEGLWPDKIALPIGEPRADSEEGKKKKKKAKGKKKGDEVNSDEEDSTKLKKPKVKSKTKKRPILEVDDEDEMDY